MSPSLRFSTIACGATSAVTGVACAVSYLAWHAGRLPSAAGWVAWGLWLVYLVTLVEAPRGRQVLYGTLALAPIERALEATGLSHRAAFVIVVGPALVGFWLLIDRPYWQRRHRRSGPTILRGAD